ncbi:MAG: hypothetical protein HY248_03065, partial [Fimbriimonas ginsengisoli]|nr:hypothetical protein [Fimbriimonas ginsengisoli]
TLAVTGASVAAALFATLIAAGIIRRLLDQARGTPRSRALGVAGIVGATLIGKIVIQWGLLFIPYLRELKIEAGQLRMVIFAVTLIIVMLLRPQGMLAHHELSWAFIGKILGIKAPAKAVTPA